MKDIIGRIKEKEYLHAALNSDRAELLAAYGRRRVGKTFLITRYLENRKGLKFFHVVGIKDGLLEEQLKEFAKAIGETFYNGATIATPGTWMKAFEELNKAVAVIKPSCKVVLFLDEFPWMATPKSRLLQAVEYYWNRYFVNDPKMKLIVCGSSASWIIKKIINNKGGLHNRITGQINLKPFNLTETKEFLKHRGLLLTNAQVLQLYMVMGGVPYYLNQINKKQSLISNINELCFKETGLLFGEFNKLFSSLFDRSEAYLEIIRLISRNRYGISRSELESKIKLSTKGGRLTDRLNDLEAAGFIQSFLPMYHGRLGAYYRLIDEYSYFYLKWVEPEKRSLLAHDEGHIHWSNIIGGQSYKSWAGYAFEAICYKHISKIKEALNIKIANKIGVWRHASKKYSDGEGAQIDLLFECKDNSTIICEIKYTDNPFVVDKEYFGKLLRKIKIYKTVSQTKNQIFVALISANGIKPTVYSEEIVTRQAKLDDLF